MHFAFDGRALTLSEFASYLAGYDFGPIAPDYVIIHSTAIPGSKARPAPGNSTPWDADEINLNENQIKAKRMAQLAKIRDFYQIQRSWTSGPHVFLDGKYVYLFTPMSQIGTHAAEGNSYHEATGKLHYSLGIEVVGHHDKKAWPDDVAAQVGTVVALLQQRLKNFSLVFGPKFHNITLHRTYNKPECPGAALTDDYVIGVINRAAVALSAKAAASPLSVHPKLLGAWQASGGIWQKDRLTPGLPIAVGAADAAGLITQRFERAVARVRADGGIDWLLLSEIAPSA